MHSTDNRSQAGQAITETAILAPLFLLIVALIFTGSQYLQVVAGLDSAARAGVIVAANDANANPGVANSVMAADARTAVEREQGCSNCFVAVANQASCSAGQNCVWVVTEKSVSNRSIEVVHVSYTVNSYLKFVNNLAVTAQAGAEA